MFDLLAVERDATSTSSAVVGPDDGVASLYLTYPDLGLSTTDLAAHSHVPDAIDRFEVIEVAQFRLATLLDRYAGGREIHFLKVDVEGSEAAVLASNDWGRHRPVIVVVEAVASWDSRPTHEAWEPTLLAHDYDFAAFDGINRFYVANEHAELAAGLAYPLSALDAYETYELVQSRERAAALAAQVGALHDEVERSRASESLARRARTEIWRLRELSEDLERYTSALKAELTDSRTHVDELQLLADHYRHAYESVISSAPGRRGGPLGWWRGPPSTPRASCPGPPLPDARRHGRGRSRGRGRGGAGRHATGRSRLGLRHHGWVPGYGMVVHARRAAA